MEITDPPIQFCLWKKKGKTRVSNEGYIFSLVSSASFAIPLGYRKTRNTRKCQLTNRLGGERANS